MKYNMFVTYAKNADLYLNWDTFESKRAWVAKKNQHCIYTKQLKAETSWLIDKV